MAVLTTEYLSCGHQSAVGLTQRIVRALKNCETKEWQKIARLIIHVAGHVSLISNCQD